MSAKQKEEPHDKKPSYVKLIENSPKFQKLKKECQVAVRLSLTGITNLVVNYEDPHLVDCFLRSCYTEADLYRGTFDLDAVELQEGSPGAGISVATIDRIIFGSTESENNENGMPVFKKDDKSFKRLREADGLVTRVEAIGNTAKDRLLIIRNIDYCLDFCQDKPGEVHPRALCIFDNFRNPNTKRGSRILLVTNEKLKLPFKVRTLEFEPVDEIEAKHLIYSFASLYERHGYEISLSEAQRQQAIRKLSGLTYSEAGDVLAESISSQTIQELPDGKKLMDTSSILRTLREKINKRFMEDASGLSHLTPKPWADYICPESSNFTFDVKKILRDFREISRLQEEQKNLINQKKEDLDIQNQINAIRSRMPHVIVLYGKGGVGKSVFPIHFAGLLDFDIWDFNIGATHSKWVGEGPERMREALKKISKGSHLVVRIDEYDRAIGGTGSSGAGMHEAYKQVEAEFMNWLQNNQEENVFGKNDIFIILTTNHKENITGPLLRSGRSDLVIDIADFDEKSMKEAFLSAPRRMKNRGALVIGFDAHELEKALKQLDLDKLASLATMKGFTVRDIDCLIQEMAAHKYYLAKGEFGMEWNTDNFVKVLEVSRGSAKEENTNELKLGDRDVLESLGKGVKDNDAQRSFDFLDTCGQKHEFDVDKIRGFVE